MGDLLHTPAQILRPEWRSTFDLDAGQARESRRRVVDEAARDGAVLFPAHFPGPGGALVRPGAEAVTDWIEVPAS